MDESKVPGVTSDDAGMTVDGSTFNAETPSFDCISRSDPTMPVGATWPGKAFTVAPLFLLGGRGWVSSGIMKQSLPMASSASVVSMRPTGGHNFSGFGECSEKSSRPRTSFSGTSSCL